MSMVIIPPLESTINYFRKGFNRAVCILEGGVETRFDEGLKQSVKFKAGDFL